MDHDDARSGLDDLSRLFEPGTAPVPAVAPTEPSPAPSADLVDPPLLAFGRRLPTASAPQPSTSGTTEPATPSPTVAPSFGTSASGAPIAGGHSAGSAGPAPHAPVPPTVPPAAAPYSPPPLVPVAPLSTIAPPMSTASPSPTPAGGSAPVAPAFGGVPIAAHRETPSPPVVSAPWSEPADASARISAPGVAPVEDVPVPAQPVGAVIPPPAAIDVPPPAMTEASAPTATPDLDRPTPDAPPHPTPYPGHGPLLPGNPSDDIVDDEQVARATLAEKIFFALTIVLPPIGLIGTAVAAVGSSRRRGWVIGLLRAGLAIGVVMSVVTAAGAYTGYKMIRQQQAHAQTVAASTAFCAAFTKDKTLGTADGGWPQPAASIPDSLTAMQAYVDRWNALAKISPAGVQPGVSSVAAAGTEIIKSVQVQRTIDDGENRPTLVSAVTSAGIADWRANYCD